MAATCSAVCPVAVVSVIAEFFNALFYLVSVRDVLPLPKSSGADIITVCLQLSLWACVSALWACLSALWACVSALWACLIVSTS